MTPIRIGDAERDAAATSLGEHYAAGRLTKTEYDERIDRVWDARFDRDLQPIFADLPRQPREVEPRADRSARRPGPAQGPPRWVRQGAWTVARFVPVAVVAMIVLVIITGTPWLLFGLFWLWIFTGFGHRHRPRQWAGTQYRHHPTRGWDGRAR